MKEIKKTHRTTNIKYQCETCGTMHYSAARAINCEKSHSCKHEPIFEFDNASEDSWWFNVRGISSTCGFCKKDLGRVDFEDIDENQEILERLFNVIDEYNQANSVDTKSRAAD